VKKIRAEIELTYKVRIEADTEEAYNQSLDEMSNMTYVGVSAVGGLYRAWEKYKVKKPRVVRKIVKN